MHAHTTAQQYVKDESKCCLIRKRMIFRLAFIVNVALWFIKHAPWHVFPHALKCNDSFSCSTHFFFLCFQKRQLFAWHFVSKFDLGRAEKNKCHGPWEKQKVVYAACVCVCNMCKHLTLWERHCWVYEQRLPAQRPVSIPVPAGFTAHFKSLLLCQHIFFFNP